MRATESIHDGELTGALRERGQRVTSQRLVIYRALRELDRHVTAEEVLNVVSGPLPGVALPTVYATLDLLHELGLARRLSIGGEATLYDARTDDHHHLRCTRCGGVEDVDARVDAEPALRSARRRGFRPAAAELVVSGVCARCA